MWGDRTQNGSVVDLVSLTEVKTKNRSTYVYDERLLNLLRAEHVGSWNLLHGFGSMLHHTYRYNETVERIEERFSLKFHQIHRNFSASHSIQLLKQPRSAGFPPKGLLRILSI